jgi:hypothetical protein
MAIILLPTPLARLTSPFFLKLGFDQGAEASFLGAIVRYLSHQCSLESMGYD